MQIWDEPDLIEDPQEALAPELQSLYDALPSHAQDEFEIWLSRRRAAGTDFSDDSLFKMWFRYTGRD